MNNVQTIDTSALKDLVDRKAVTVVEVLMPAEYEKGHIPGAIHVHFATIAGRARALFSKEQTIVTYCHNRSCRAGRIAASKLRSLGYNRTYYYPEGKDGWTAAGYDLEPSPNSTDG